MTKRQMSLRVSDATRSQLEELAIVHGTQTSAVSIAIDRLYQDTFRFELRHAGRPYGPTEDMSDIEGRVISRHATMDAAQAALTKANREMHENCGPTAWDDHYWIVPLVDYRFIRYHTCHGHLDDFGRTAWCPTSEVVEVAYTWKAGYSRRPAPIVPDGWADTDQCADCRSRDAYYNSTIDVDEKSVALHI